MKEPCVMEASEVPPLKGCPVREITSSRTANAPALPPLEPVKGAKKEAVKEEKKEAKKEAKAEAKALTQKKGEDDFWNPPCDWHLSEDGSECISKQAKCESMTSEKPQLKNCPNRYSPYQVNRDGSANTADRSANAPPASKTPPAEAKKEEAKGEKKEAKEAKKEEKKEEKKASLVQKKLKDNFWTPSCDWHLSEDGSDCVTKAQKCTETDSPKPAVKDCPNRYAPYQVNKDRTPIAADRAATAPPAPPAEPIKKEAPKEEVKEEVKVEAKEEKKE